MRRLLAILLIGSHFIYGGTVLGVQQNLRIVPDKDEADAGEVFIKAEVDGTTIDLKLDSGATFTSLVGVDAVSSYSELKKMDFKGVGGESRTGSVIEVKNFKINSENLKNFQVVRASVGGGRQSTLGINAFKSKTFSFDSKAKILTFDEMLNATSNRFEIGKAGHIYLPVQYSAGGPKMSGIWDTGAGLTLVDISDIKSNPSNFVFIKNSSGDDTTGSNISVPIYKMKFLKIGSLEFHDIKVLAMDLSGMRQAIGDNIRLAIGYNVILKHYWHFDLKNLSWSSE